MCKIKTMRPTLILIAICIWCGACRPAAPPVSVGSQPVSINGVRSKNAGADPKKPLAEMSWTSFGGDVQKLKDYRGKVVVLDFWATNCPPCIKEIPHLLAIQKANADSLQVIGLHVGDDEDRQKVPEFTTKLNITYPLAYPDDALVDFIFDGNSAIPQTAVFGRDGKLVKKIIGFSDEIQAELDQAIADAVKENGNT